VFFFHSTITFTLKPFPLYQKKYGLINPPIQRLSPLSDVLNLSFKVFLREVPTYSLAFPILLLSEEGLLVFSRSPFLAVDWPPLFYPPTDYYACFFDGSSCGLSLFPGLLSCCRSRPYPSDYLGGPPVWTVSLLLSVILVYFFVFVPSFVFESPNLSRWRLRVSLFPP